MELFTMIMKRRCSAALAVGVLVGFAAAPAIAQNDRQSESTGYGAVIDNIDLLLDNYANFLARKYDLTDEQDAYTRQLLRERSYEFLDQYEDELRDLVDRLFEVRTGADMDDQELIEWGQRVAPIYEKARDLIIQGNNDWREILSDSQKRIHDEDLKLMYKSFETTEEQIQRIVSGEMTVEEFRNPRRFRNKSASRANSARPRQTPPPPTAQGAPPSPTDSPARMQPTGAGEPIRRITPEGAAENAPPNPRDVPPPRPRSERRATRNPESPQPKQVENQPRTARRSSKSNSPVGEWERYVEQFIARYKLNDEQTQQAHAILADCKKQAESYTRSRQSMIEEIDKRAAELKADKDKQTASKRKAEISKLEQRKADLLAPISQIFERQLKPKLEKLPTRAQRRAAEQAEAKKSKEGTRRSRRAEKDSEE
ncbi:MAG: hypothetical protein D6744_00755 [Planctomycetota bacterium]|nr:MAG: hypothetical protein D6744_00755 [Planctomycetota bacterium]